MSVLRINQNHFKGCTEKQIRECSHTPVQILPAAVEQTGGSATGKTANASSIGLINCDKTTFST